LTNDAIEDYIGIRTCEIALKIIDAVLGEDERRTVERRVRKKGTRVAFYGGGRCLFYLSRMPQTFDSEVEFDLIDKNREEVNRET